MFLHANANIYFRKRLNVCMRSIQGNIMLFYSIHIFSGRHFRKKWANFTATLYEVQTAIEEVVLAFFFLSPAALHYTIVTPDSLFAICIL